MFARYNNEDILNTQFFFPLDNSINFSNAYVSLRSLQENNAHVTTAALIKNIFVLKNINFFIVSGFVIVLMEYERKS